MWVHFIQAGELVAAFVKDQHQVRDLPRAKQKGGRKVRRRHRVSDAELRA